MQKNPANPKKTFAQGGVIVTIRSLSKSPSVPGPEYLEAGCMKVTNASNQFCSRSILIPDELIVETEADFTSPYPSNRMHPGGNS